MNILYTRETIGSIDTIRGVNRNEDVGLLIHVPDGESFTLGDIAISNVFIGIIKTGDGMLHLGNVTIHSFGGDAMNIRGSNVSTLRSGGTIYTNNNTPTRPYSTIYRQNGESVKDALATEVYDHNLLEWDDQGRVQGYHQDCIFQAYAVKSDGYTLHDGGGISNIYFPRIKSNIRGLTSQGIMCSEVCDYSYMTLGTELLDIKAEYPFPMVFNSLRLSKIGHADCQMSGAVKIVPSKSTSFLSVGNVIQGVELIGGGVSNVTKEVVNMMNLRDHAEELGVEYEMLEAIRSQESRGVAFRYGLPSLLFECHVFDRSLRANKVNPSFILRDHPSSKDIICLTPYTRYGSYRKQIRRYRQATNIHPDSAIEACSWGLFQILGENWEMCGYSNPSEFKEAMMTEEGQLDAFVRYIRNRKGLLEALRAKNWRKIKKLYQGSMVIDRDKDGKDDYEASLIRNYTRAIQRNGKRKPLRKSVTMRNNAAGAVVKAATGSGVLLGSDSIVTSLSAITEQIDQLSEIKTSVVRAAEKLDSVKEQMFSANEALSALSWLPWAVGFLLILAVIPHIRVALAYMKDNGYV